MDLSGMRGYFGIGIEGVSKPMNVGSLLRTAHAFDAAFVFTVRAAYRRRKSEKADTSRTLRHVPFYSFPDAESMILPQGCGLIGVEITDTAAELPSFRHPSACAYVLGPERGSLSPAMLSRCAHVVRIPTRFAVNVALAGALVMYDRVRMRAAAPRAAGAGRPRPDLKAWSSWRAGPPPADPAKLEEFLGGGNGADQDAL